jgi:quercetin dioxygenase-like cupin family protein
MRFLPLLIFNALTFSSAGQDAAVVSPKIVKLEFENQQIRILRARYAPHERLEMHSHPTKAEVQITDGAVRIFTPENVGTDPLELVEMKNVTAQSIPVAAPSHTETTPSNQPLPVEQEPHHRWEFQNQYVRVLDVLLAPGQSTLFHTHSHDSIAVRLSEATIQEQVFEKNWQSASKVMPGDVRYAQGAKSPYTHRVKNVGTTPFHVIDIELLQ